MLPRSPESPTVRSKRGSGAGRSCLPSSSVHRRTKDCFISVDGLSLPIHNARIFNFRTILTAVVCMPAPGGTSSVAAHSGIFSS